jgi:hypothetical protein
LTLIDFSKTLKTDSSYKGFQNSGKERKMKTHNLGKTFNPINLRKLAKPVALCISILFIISMLPALSSNTIQARTILGHHQQPTPTPTPTRALLQFNILR